jgi:hypothetical protein
VRCSSSFEPWTSTRPFCNGDQMSQMWVERLKWPDVPHYRHLGWVLGDDEYGLWIELRVGTPVYRHDEILSTARTAG